MSTRTTGHLRGFSYGKYEQTLLLPKGTDLDRISATFHNGVLEITAPLGSGRPAEEDRGEGSRRQEAESHRLNPPVGAKAPFLQGVWIFPGPFFCQKNSRPRQCRVLRESGVAAVDIGHVRNRHLIEQRCCGLG